MKISLKKCFALREASIFLWIFCLEVCENKQKHSQTYIDNHCFTVLIQCCLICAATCARYFQGLQYKAQIIASCGCCLGSSSASKQRMWQFMPVYNNSKCDIVCHWLDHTQISRRVAERARLIINHQLWVCSMGLQYMLCGTGLPQHTFQFCTGPHSLYTNL